MFSAQAQGFARLHGGCTATDTARRSTKAQVPWTKPCCRASGRNPPPSSSTELEPGPRHLPQRDFRRLGSMTLGVSVQKPFIDVHCTEKAPHQKQSLVLRVSLNKLGRHLACFPCRRLPPGGASAFLIAVPPERTASSPAQARPSSP